MQDHFHKLYLFYDLPEDLRTIRPHSLSFGILPSGGAFYQSTCNEICASTPSQPSNTRGVPSRGEEKEKKRKEKDNKIKLQKSQVFLENNGKFSFFRYLPSVLCFIGP